MDLKAYYRLISSEGKAKNSCRKNASKAITGFAPAADAENYTNYEMDAIIALAVNIPSTSSPEGGLTRDD